VGQGYEFTAITSVVLGGVLLGGGRGWVLSAAAGAFTLELLFTFLTVRGVESTWRPTVQGVIIILAVAVAGRAWTGARRPPRRSRRTDRSNARPNPTPTPGTTTTGDS
jgi:ribose transport system permease protein